jgi:hypothetical protein
VSFYVQGEGVVYVQAGTLFPAHCPECPAYIPLQPGMTRATRLKCWNCGLQGSLELFVEDGAEYEFTPERQQ